MKQKDDMVGIEKKIEQESAELRSLIANTANSTDNTEMAADIKKV